MIVNYRSKYKRDYKKLLNKHMKKEIETLERIIMYLKLVGNMRELLDNPYSKIFHIEKKSGNLKSFYTARINEKIRLFIRPANENLDLVYIVEVELSEINLNHYNDG